MSRVRGIVFDSADVLVRPVTVVEAPSTEAWRRWFPGPRFEEIVRAHVGEVSLDGLSGAIERGMTYLGEQHREPLASVEGERELYAGFYRIVLEQLGLAAPPAALVADLARARVDEEEIVAFTEVEAVLVRLRDRGLRLGVLTEGWPSIERKYERIGLRQFFHAFVISAQEARLKDDPVLFDIASRRMALRPPEMLFVDDWPPHVQTAIGQGYRGAVVDRLGDAPRIEGIKYVPDLLGVERLLDNVLAPTECDA